MIQSPSAFTGVQVGVGEVEVRFGGGQLAGSAPLRISPAGEVDLRRRGRRVRSDSHPAGAARRDRQRQHAERSGQPSAHGRAGSGVGWALGAFSAIARASLAYFEALFAKSIACSYSDLATSSRA